MVHNGVKLKSRLLKPSIVLPMGNYIATSANLKFIVKQFGKDIHGIRMRDLDHKDKQNFAEVENIIRQHIYYRAFQMQQ